MSSTGLPVGCMRTGVAILVVVRDAIGARSSFVK
jgi:hypothetical protein